MPSDRHKAVYLPFRCSGEKAEEIKRYADTRRLLVSEAMRELIDVGLKAENGTLEKSEIEELVKTATAQAIKPGVERIAAITAKATQIDAAAFFMFLYTLTRDGSQEEQAKIQEAVESARRLGIQYLKLKDRDIDSFLSEGAKQIVEEN